MVNGIPNTTHFSIILAFNNGIVHAFRKILTESITPSGYILNAKKILLCVDLDIDFSILPYFFLRRMTPDAPFCSELQALSALFDADVREVFDFKASINRRGLPGGSGEAAVRAQMRQARGEIEKD